MCGGQSIKVGSVVRRPIRGLNYREGVVLGEVISIDKSNKRHFVYTVKFDDGTTDSFRNRDIVVTSRKAWQRVVDRYQAKKNK